MGSNWIWYTAAAGCVLFMLVLLLGLCQAASRSDRWATENRRDEDQRAANR